MISTASSNSKKYDAMKTPFLLLLVLLGLIGCAAEQSIEGYWESGDGVLKVSKAGDVHQVLFQKIYNPDRQSFAGRFEKGEIQLGAGLCNKLSYLADTKKILFCGKEFEKFSGLDLGKDMTEDIVFNFPIYKADMLKALNSMTVGKIAVAEALNTNKKLPDTNVEAGLPPQISEITIEKGGVISTSLRGTKIFFVPTVSNNAIVWKCSAKGLDAMFFPKTCR